MMRFTTPEIVGIALAICFIALAVIVWYGM
jgi:hypothetical protein